MRIMLAATTILFALVGLGVRSTPVAAQAATGTIQGKIVLNGPAPANPLIRMGADPLCGRLNREAGKRPVQELVLKAADGGLANAFVDLDGTFPATPVSTEPVVINQRGCVYGPRVVGARVGQTLRIVNSDTLIHEVHSISTKGNDFKTTQPQSGMVFNYTLKAPEVLHVKCDIHSWMNAYVGITASPYFAVSGSDGTFTIQNVPAGKYTLRSWHERFGRQTETIEVKPGAATTVTLTYSGTEKPATDVAELIVPAFLHVAR